MTEVLMIPGTDCPADSLTIAGWEFTVRVWAAAHASQPDGDDAEAWLDWIEDGGDPDAWYAAWRARNPGPDMAAVKTEAAAVARAMVSRHPEWHRAELAARTVWLAARATRTRRIERYTAPMRRVDCRGTARPREQRAGRGHTRARAPDDDGPSDPPPAEPQPAAEVAPSGSIEVLYRVVFAIEALQLADYGTAEAVLRDLEDGLRNAA